MTQKKNVFFRIEKISCIRFKVAVQVGTTMSAIIAKEKLRVKVAGLIFGGVFMVGLIFGFSAIPAILKHIVSNVKTLKLLNVRLNRIFFSN